MICVTVGRGRHKMMAAEHAALAQQGAKLIELRLDWLRRDPMLPRLLNDRPTPVIVTCRRPEDGGRYRGSEETRLALLRQAIVSGVEFVDLEEDVAPKIPRYGKTRRIVSYHNFKETPADLEEIHERLCKLDADIVKIVTFANSPKDNIRMLKLVQNASKPTAGFCMGEFGVVSRLLCGRYGSPLTYAASDQGHVLAPGQISYSEMRQLYRYNRINKETVIFGVLGDPIGHSWSPLLHNTAFREKKFNAVYLPMRVPAEEFDETLRAYEFLGVRGYSVTIPHKEAALKFAHSTDDAAKAIGAANTLFKAEGGHWSATNTDYSAAMESVELGLKARGADQQLAGQRVLILGAGGVARAITLGAVRAGALVTITNRSNMRAVKLAEELGAKSVTWPNRGAVGADIIINCTPVGMSPKMDDSPFEEQWFPENAVVFDTIYNPENTLFLSQARERGCHVVSGIEMFVRQAAAQFKLFTRQDAPIETMVSALRKGLSPYKAAAKTLVPDEEDEEVEADSEE